MFLIIGGNPPLLVGFWWESTITGGIIGGNPPLLVGLLVGIDHISANQPAIVGLLVGLLKSLVERIPSMSTHQYLTFVGGHLGVQPKM